jgi:NAD(P)-dependent dehydrogenase (short-subunit alcohol dehydrogenase family)
MRVGATLGRALVFGASGGVGGALAVRLRDQGYETMALARKPSPDWSGAQLRFDLEDEGSLASAAAELKDGAPIRRVIVATGLLHADGLMPERSNASLNAAQLMRLYAVNAAGPALIAKHFLPLLPRAEPSVFAALSARVGSIGDNRLGGWHSYRASKAALNMLIRTMAIELKRTRPHAILVGLHPGTVDTGLSRPFQRNVPEGRLFTPDESAARLLVVVDGLGLEDSGGVFAWNGARVPE